jgi:two-component system, NarL family, nitrate/nitrite response regulator NarL
MVDAVVEVFLVAGTRFYREGLADALGRRPGLRVVGTAGSARDALGRIRLLEPDVVLLDTAVAGMSELVRNLGDAATPISVIALALIERAPEVLACAEAGVSGYVTQDASLEDLAGTIRGVLRGELRCPPRIAATLFKRVATLAAAPGRPLAAAVLTSREREVLAMLDEGLSNKQIAARLCIEVATVKNHVHHILEKLQVASRSAATAYARRHPQPWHVQLTRKVPDGHV